MRDAPRQHMAKAFKGRDWWCRLSNSELESHQLKLLRAELGLDPSPADTDDREIDRRNKRRA